MVMETIFGIGAGLSAISSTVAGVSSYSQGNANAKIAEQQGQAVKQAQVVNEPIYREEAESLMSQQVAANAAAGVAADSPALRMNMVETEWRYMRDRRRREYEADLGVSQAQSQSSMYKAKAKADLTGSLIETLGNAGSQTTNYLLAKK